MTTEFDLELPDGATLHAYDTGARWLARRCPRAELRVSAEDGHISVLGLAAGALEWLRAQAARA